MSRVDPITQFLGVHPDSDELDLLGINPAYISQAGVQAALASRLALVFDHPNGRSVEAEAVRVRLREAADRLLDDHSRKEILEAHIPMQPRQPSSIRMDPAPTKAPPAPKPVQTAMPGRPVLSPLQERLLAVLAGCGGWNAASRAQLASVAAEHHLSPADMLGILEELAVAMRAGAMVAPRPTASAASVSARAMEPGFLERVIDQYAPELRQDDPRSLLKLSLLFAGIGLLALVLMYRILFPDIVQEGQSGAFPPLALDGAEDSTLASAGSDPDGSTQDDFVPMATFGAIPALQLRAVDPVVHDAVDAAAGTVREIDSFARRCIGLRSLDEGMLDEWTQLLQTASTGWFHTDPATAQAMRRAVVRVMEHAGSNPEVFRPLQLAFGLIPPGSVRTPLGIPRGAWRIGTMAMVAEGESVSPAARANATRLLQSVQEGDVQEGGFAPAVVDWLTRLVPSMISRAETSDDAIAEWSLWFACLRSLPDESGRHEALLAALPALTRTQTNLARRGPTQQILGRVLAELDWEQSDRVQPIFLGLFSEPEVTSTDLWVITSLLAHLDETSWYGQDLVLGPEATVDERRRMQNRLRANWPMREDGVLAMGDIGLYEIDPVLAETWQAVWTQVRTIPASRTETGRLQRILIERLLQEAAVDLFIGDGQQVLGALNQVESLVQEVQVPAAGGSASSTSTPMIPGGQVDGHWARSYTARSMSKNDRLDLIRALEVQSGSDLGPLDAAVLASEAIGATIDVREAASYLIQRKFAQSPNVAIAMVDQFPGAGRIAGAKDVSRLIETLTGVELPRSNSARWPVEARLALVQHAMDLRLSEANATDSIAVKLAASLQREARLLGRMVEVGAAPDESAREVTAAWQDHVERDARLRGLPNGWIEQRSARDRFASDAIQRCLAERIATSELVRSLLSAWIPSQVKQIDALFDVAMERRVAASHVLEQFVWTETMMVEAWSVLIEATLAEQTEGGGA